jgi:hypothetical protein
MQRRRATCCGAARPSSAPRWRIFSSTRSCGESGCAASRQSTIAIWKADFLTARIISSPPVGSDCVWALQYIGLWAVPPMLAPIYLTHRTYKVHVCRLEAERHG